ncbi:peroxisomal ATPase PEX6-like [Amphiura filiformis]|uniref:peroxisomal ATPase PEX6-like n=1 Tax=Amphiura filiformis TaxID=82378 RepID=UPI003B21EC1B
MADQQGSRLSRLSATFSRFNFPVDHNSLHLGISRSSSSLLLRDNIDSYAIVALIPESKAGKPGENRELFVCLHILNDDMVRRSISLCQVSEVPNTITLYSTEFFHKHYQISDAEDVYIRCVKVFPLTKVIFGSKSSQCYDWAKNHVFSTGLLVSACQQKVLVRNRDLFLAPVIPVFDSDDAYDLSNYLDLVALECEPVMQGVITVNTSIVITQMDEKEGEEQTADDRNKQFHKEQSMQGSSLFANDVQATTYNSLPEPRLVSEFALQLYDSASSLTLDTVFNSEISQLSTCSELLLRPVLVPKSATHESSMLNPMCMLEDQCEVSYRVGVTKTTLSRLHAFNGSWVLVSIPVISQADEDDRYSQASTEEKRGSISTLSKEELVQSKEEKKDNLDNMKQIDDKINLKEANTHLAQVFVIDQSKYTEPVDHPGLATHVPYELSCEDLSPEDNVVYLSPLLWFNLQEHPSTLIQPNAVVSIRLANKELESQQSITVSSCSISRSSQPHLATEIHLALVKSSDYPMTSNFDQAVKKHFSQTRVISLGDVIALQGQYFPEYTQDITEGVHMRLPLICYKVTKILPVVEGAASFLVNSLLTSVYQAGPVNSFIPVTMDVYLSSYYDPIWGSPMPAGIANYVDEVEELLLPYLVPRSQCNRLTPSILLTGPSSSGKSTAIKSVCRRLNMHYFPVSCYDLCGDTSASTEAKITNLAFKAGLCTPCILLMRNVHVVAKTRDGTSEDPRVIASLKDTIQSLVSTNQEWPIIVIATAPSSKSVAADLQCCFLHHIEMKTPIEEERTELLGALCQKLPLATDVDISHISKRTAGMVLGDLCALMSHTSRATLGRVVSACSVGTKLTLQEEKDVCAAGIQVHAADFETALDHLQATHADSIGAPKIPNVSWEDVGGLANVRAEILDTIQLPLQHPELFAAGLRRSGVLLYGPPGTGKTLLAKAVATECSLNFLSVKGPELINMYVGQSEENVREVFNRARGASPCVIFFDELDSLAPNRGRSGDSGGVMDRVVSQLLAELDGLHKSSDVFVIGATNRPDLLDSALLRPGRFDKLLYLGISEDRGSQVKILQALTRKFTLGGTIKLEGIAESCPTGLTGADFYALCSDAMLNAVKRKITQIQAGEPVTESQVVVEEEDFIAALQGLVPSVPEQELQHYKQIQQQFNQNV